MIVLIACSLALDAFAVALSCGVSLPRFGVCDCVKLGLYFGLFQFIMPLIGYFLGTGLSHYVQAVDHWIAFALLCGIGGNMVVKALAGSAGPAAPCPLTLSPGRLITLAVATSIDALAVGVSMAFVTTTGILPACLVIGLVAFAFTLAGGLLGRRLGPLFQQRATLLGGLVLMGIGVRVLAEHLI